MDTIVAILRYTFALVLAVEVALILRALFYLARDKAQAAEPAEE